jgi:hypothetical protein
MRPIAFALSAALLAIGLARADILPPGGKWINHVAKFENVGDFTEYLFYVYPRDLHRGRPGNSSVRVPESGEVSIGGFNPLAAGGGIFLFAIPKKLHVDTESSPAEKWFTTEIAGVLKSKALVTPIRSVDRSDERDQIVTTYRIRIGQELELTEVAGESRQTAPTAVTRTTPIVVSGLFGRGWHWIVGGAATGAVLVCACWLAFRKKVQ